MNKIFLLIALLGFSTNLYSQEELSPPPVESLKKVEKTPDVESLKKIQQNIEVFQRTNNESLIQKEIDAANSISSQKFENKDQLSQYIKLNDKTGGFFKFVNIVWFFSTILIAISIGWLSTKFFGFYAIEFVGYGLCTFGIVSGAIEPRFGIWLVVPACLMLIGFLALTERLHFKEYDKKAYERNPGKGWLVLSMYQVQFLILTVVYAGCALYYESSLLGFMTIIALEGLLGFTVVVAPLCIAMGFESDKVMPRATAASFGILSTYLITIITMGDFGPFKVFESGALFVGAFVYFLGLLIMSSYYYEKANKYLLMQIITIVSGFAAFYIGSVFKIDSLLGVGGTFFSIYLLTKYIELPLKELGAAVSLLGAGLILFLFSLFAYNFPQYFFLG